jgi:hypothetical protein
VFLLIQLGSEETKSIHSLSQQHSKLGIGDNISNLDFTLRKMDTYMKRSGKSQ